MVTETHDAIQPDRRKLIDAALRLYLKKTRREYSDGNSWIRQPNNLISVVALFLSLLSVGYQLEKDRSDGIDKDLASLSAIVSELTKLDSDVLTTSVKDPQVLENLSIFVTNRRVALLAEADRLIGNLGSKAPHVQLAVLGPEYFQVNDYATAMKYFRLMTGPPSTLPEQLGAWRSIGIAYFNEGPASIEDARKAFAQAVAVYPDPKDIGSIGSELTVHEQWAQFELSFQNDARALQQFGEARTLAYRLPCSPARTAFITRIDAESGPALQTESSRDPQQATSVRQAWSELDAADTCPKTAAAAPVLETQDGATPAQTTTVCRFTSGPRAGSVVDFAPYGVRGIPPGSSCTDGLGSIGVGVKK
jgi:hypothetical protein